MRRPFFFAVLALFIISFSRTANPEDKASEVSAPAEVEVPAVVAEAEKPVEPEAKVLIDDSLPEGAVTEGKWEWDTSLIYRGEKSHTEPAAKGVAEHSCRMAPLEIPEDYLIEQYVYLDPADPPEGIELKFRYEADGREAEIGLYREGEIEVFVFNDDEAVIYDGTLTEPGRWVKWSIDPDDLGLKHAKITGISFVVYGGKANWDLTQFVPSKKYHNNPQPEGASN